MQIIRPEMHPLIAGFLILFLFFIGVISLILLYSGLKNLKRNNLRMIAVLKVVFGCVILGFAIYNWIGYNSIFSKYEMLIVGEYRSDNSKLTIETDYTWKITGNDESIFKLGKWEYVMSEDWCYWNIESDNMKCRTQIGTTKIGSPPMIDFKEQNLIFKRKK